MRPLSPRTSLRITIFGASVLPSTTSADTSSPKLHGGGLRGLGRGRCLGDLVGVTVSCLLVLIAFFPIVFQGRSLSASSNRVASTNGVYPFPGQPPDTRPPDYRPDLAASSWQFEPWAQVTHREYARGEVPLWNPYQGAGAPLAANMQSAVFDPLLLPVNLNPTPRTWDFAMVGAFLLGAAAAYAFARVLGLDIIPSVGTSAAFSLSGYFFLYSNNQITRSYVYLPILLLLVELVLRSRRALPVAGLAIAVAANIYLGMPEASALILGTTAAYGLVRLFQRRADGSMRASGARLGSGLVFGLLLAAPLLLLFQQYQALSFNTHQTSSGAGSAVDPLGFTLNWVAPFFNGSKSGPDSLFRDWCGAAAAVAALLGLSGRRETRRLHAWFFFWIATIFVLKTYNFKVLAWLGHLPILERIIYPIFAKPVIGFAIAILAGIGVQVLWRRDLNVKRFLMLLATSVVVTGAVALRNHRQVTLPPFGVAAPIWGRVALAGGIVLFAALVIVRKNQKVAATLACAAIAAELLSLAPHGIYAPRANPFVAPDWVPTVHEVLQREPNARVFGLDAKLYPNTAGALGLQDIRALDALYVERYWRYVRTFLQPSVGDRFLGGPYGSQETEVAQYRANPMFDALAVRVILSQAPIAGNPTAVNGTVDGFALRGRDANTMVYENLNAYPRAWIVHKIHPVHDENAAFSFLTARSHSVHGAAIVDRFDPRTEAAIERRSGERTPRSNAGPACQAANDHVKIDSYTGDHVTLTVDAQCPGLLVLPDTYYPGWSASVNGHGQTIYPTDGALRGVAVPKGPSVVRFSYQPQRFAWGLVISGLAILAILAFLGLHWWPRRRTATRPS